MYFNILLLFFIINMLLIYTFFSLIFTYYSIHMLQICHIRTNLPVLHFFAYITSLLVHLMVTWKWSMFGKYKTLNLDQERTYFSSDVISFVTLSLCQYPKRTAYSQEIYYDTVVNGHKMCIRDSFSSGLISI